jgi:hypothetical protein
MDKLTYFIDKGYDNYEEFYEYLIPRIKPDEIYARQLCTYFIKDDKQYELISNEMNGHDEILVLKEMGENKKTNNEINYKKKDGINIEMRKIDRYDDHAFISSLKLKSHWEVIRYLLKDYVDIPGEGQLAVSSTEIDEDRSCYVIYVKE